MEACDSTCCHFSVTVSEKVTFAAAVCTAEGCLDRNDRGVGVGVGVGVGPNYLNSYI